MTTSATETKLQGYTDKYRASYFDSSYEFTSLQAHHADRSIPDRAITQVEEAQFTWLAAFHKSGGGCTAVGRDVLNEFSKRQAFVMSLDRAVGKKATSGVTVSTKWPLRLELAVSKLKPPLRANQWLDPASFSEFTFQRYLDTWLEHERVVVASSAGMRVMI